MKKRDRVLKENVWDSDSEEDSEDRSKEIRHKKKFAEDLERAKAKAKPTPREVRAKAKPPPSRPSEQNVKGIKKNG